MQHMIVRFAWVGIANVALCILSPVGEGAVSLLTSNSLAAWDYGETGAWKIEDGVLSATEESSPLLSGFSVGDFLIHLTARSKQGAKIILRLHELKGKGIVEVPLQITACSNSDGCLTSISRTGDTLTISDGTQMTLPEATHYALGLRVEKGQADIHEILLTEPEGDAIFNGVDLSGWQGLAGKGNWYVSENGTIVKPVDENANEATYLRTESNYENFNLSLEYRIQKGGNSGIAFRTPDTGWPSSDGFELQILDRFDEPGKENMSLYGNVSALAKAQISGQWNRLLIKADGRHISVWLNEQLVQHINTESHPELKHRQMKGWIGLQDHLDEVEFRNIRLLAAPDGRGLSGWYVEDGETQPFGPLERLMNPERLTGVDDIRSGYSSHQIHSPAESILFDVAGPGAIVGITTEDTTGGLRFYIDGSSEPQISCDAGELHAVLPDIGGDLAEGTNPLLTWLPFSSHLRIIADQSATGNYGFSYVTQSESAEYPPCEEDLAAFARQWKPALTYRLFQHRFNKIPHQSNYRLANGVADQIKPEERVELFSIDGGGLVDWLRLECDPASLHSNDLWLEITIDGEETPSIYCPARMWYAPLANGVDHFNYLMTSNDGYVSRLAIPFDSMLTVAIRNRGKQSLNNIGMTASHQPCIATDQREIPVRMKLRTIFSEFTDGDASMKLLGPGRLVGLIAEGVEPGKMILKNNSIDGKVQAEWSNMTLEDLLATENSTTRANYHLLSGCDKQLAWRYFLMAPLDFAESLILRFHGSQDTRILGLYYQEQE